MKLGFGATDQRRHPSGAAALALAGLVSGFALGSLVHLTGGPLLRVQPVFDWAGQLWLNALVMIALPLVVGLIMSAIMAEHQAGEAERLGGLTVLWFAAFLIGAGLMTVFAGSSVVRWFPAAPAVRAAMRSSLGHPAAGQATGAPFAGWISNIVPSNLFHALAGGEVLPVIVAVVLFALAARTIQPERRALLHLLASAVADVSLALARWVLRLLPVAVFAMSFAAAAKAGGGIAGGVAYFVVLCSLLLIVATLLTLPLTAWLGRIPLRQFARGVWPCQIVALTTRSSLAALPSLLDRGRSVIGLSPQVSNFVLPVSVSVFKLNRTISSPLKVIVLAHLYGLPVTVGSALVFVAVAALTSFGTPGLPSGGSVITIPFYLAAGLPLEGIVLLNAVDSIPDLFKTTLNVTSDMSVAVIVSRFAGLPVARERPAGESAARRSEAVA